MPQIEPTTDLHGTTEISVEMQEISAVDTIIAKAEAEYQQTDRLYDARDVLASLRRKHFGA